MPENWLIAVDLDGTLFHTDHQISERTLSTMHDVAKLGHRIVIVTGRSSHSSVPRLTSMPDGIHMLCSNGAYEYDRDSGTILWANKLSTSNSIEIRRIVLTHLPSASFGWETVNGLNYEDKFIDEAGGAHTLEQGGRHEQLGDMDIIKLFVRTPEQKGEELATSLDKLFNNEFEIASSGVPFVEITATGVNKGTALEKVATRLGFASNRTIAFGDNFNDMPMFQWAGESVAMGNAVAKLKALSTAHTLSHAEDGVAHYLTQRFIGASN